MQAPGRRFIRGQIDNPADPGTRVTARPFTYDRDHNPATPPRADPELPGKGECVTEYPTWGRYTLTVTVDWNVFICRGPDADGDWVPEVRTLVCSTPKLQSQPVEIPVNVHRIRQRIIGIDGVRIPGLPGIPGGNDGGG